MWARWKCGCGEIGRRTRLRIWRRKVWRFKSSRPHQIKQSFEWLGWIIGREVAACICSTGSSRSFQTIAALECWYGSWQDSCCWRSGYGLDKQNGTELKYSLSTCGSSSAVEHRLAKARVASSNLVFRSILWRHSQVVRQRSAKPLLPSSSLGAASKFHTARWCSG